MENVEAYYLNEGEDAVCEAIDGLAVAWLMLIRYKKAKPAEFREHLNSFDPTSHGVADSFLTLTGLWGIFMHGFEASFMVPQNEQQMQKRGESNTEEKWPEPYFPL